MRTRNLDLRPQLARPVLTGGAGLDVVEIERLAQIRQRRPAFFERYFSTAERARAESSSRPARSYARAFAAKEAFLKAMGRGVLDGIPVTEVEWVEGRLRLGPPARALLAKGAQVQVSVADDGRNAWAIVMVG